MSDTLISSRRNPLVKRLRSLSSRAGREEEGLLLLEGTHLLQELVRLKLQPAELIATERWYQRHAQLLVGVNQAIPRRLVTDEVLTAALSTVTPDGVASLCPYSALPLAPKDAHFLLVLDRIQDPGNLGTLLRTALAADVQNVWLGSGVDPLGSKSLRASAGALLQLPHHRFGPDEDTAISQLTDELKRLAAGGMQVVATLVPGSQVPIRPVPYWELNWRLPTALVLGTEGAGLHPELLACCTHAVTLPHSSRVESLNVAAAAVPLLLERRRATMTATTQQSG
ncbi:TrmH family RNA methyltransferase [Parasynechococcus marenigrum]|uniref:TrmH family RNA methyltransferase n=1 Tax=Parasynechococcus marenigrum TaxID=2881428 RepID=UPI0005A8D788|nr:RNA methyltransferase [Parasynechococcus marenigrum]